MKKLLQTSLLGLMTMSLLVACGDKDTEETTPSDSDSANIGTVINKVGPNDPECPDISGQEVCTSEGVQYRSACDATMDNASNWQPCKSPTLN